MADQKSFMQVLAESVRKAVNGEVGQAELAGLSRDQVVKVVDEVTQALDRLPTETSMHAVLFGLTYVRNGIVAAMQANTTRLKTESGGSA